MKVFQSPSKYIQHKGAILHAGYHIKSAFPKVKKAGVIMPGHLMKKYESPLISTLENPMVYDFDGECTHKNIDIIVNAFAKNNVDHVVAFGGGKVLDVGKMVAYKMESPTIIIPSSASTDAPCTALSVVYKEDGSFEEYKFFPKNPDIVLVDSEVIISAPCRYFVSGIGDAMSTFYEADACLRNPKARNLIYPFTYRPPLIAQGIGKLCLDILYKNGLKAKYDCMYNDVTDALETVIEANILLSGLGAESGGLAIAHAFHNALTEFPECHHFLHGEKVAFGTIVQLVAEDNIAEAIRVAYFNKKIGLPYSLKDLHVHCTDENIEKLAELCLQPGSTAYNVGYIVHDKMVAAIKDANSLFLKP